VKFITDPFRPQRKKIILYHTHFWDEACAREFAALRGSLSAAYDLAVLGFVAGTAEIAVPPEVPRFLFTARDLPRLGYPRLAKLRPFHIDTLRFFREYPDYDQYWLIEYDVRYTGHWADLLQDLSASRADLMATVIQSRTEHPKWPHWRSLRTGAGTLPESCRLKAFLPLVRLSRAALRAMEAAHQSGWVGHYETFWPSAVAAAGLRVEDIGGTGRFTPRDRQGKYYTTSSFDPSHAPGSFEFRPPILEHQVPRVPALLWHPVKSAAMIASLPPEPPPGWRGHRLVRKLRGLRPVPWAGPFRAHE
jgi:hypothetical protein